MRPVHVAWLLCLSFPAAALAASAPSPSKNVPPPKCTTSVGFPALDASSKDAAKMTLKTSPETSRDAHKEGKVTSQSVKTQSIGSATQGAGGGKCVAGEHSGDSPKETVH